MRLLVKTLSMLSLLAALVQAGCGIATPRQRSAGEPRQAESGESASAEYQRIVARISGIVGKQLDLDVREVDMDVPLWQQKKASEELDVVEIIMSVEEAFNIEIKDEDVGESWKGFGRDVSVKKLADIVSKKKSLK